MISDLLKKTDVGRGKLDQIMKAKASCGDSAYNQISDALDQTDDPQKRSELEKMRGQLDDWMKQRDARLAREKSTVDGLGNRLDATQSEIVKQRQAIEDARRSLGPANTTAGGKIIDSSHIQPQAVDYARGLRDVLAGSRARLDKAMSLGSGA